MALALRKTFSLFNPILYRCQWNVAKKLSVENKPQSVPRDNVAVQPSVIEKLKSEYGNGVLFNILIKENPHLSYTNFTTWSGFFKLMNSFHFEINELLSMIRDCPDLLQIPEDVLRERLEVWHQRLKRVNSEEAKVLLFHHPNYLTIDSKTLRSKIHFLTDFAERNRKNVNALLLLNPNIMFESQDRLIEKMNYLLVDWRFTPLEISRCKALTYPIDHVKLRMTLLYKCGIYKMPYLYTWKKKKVELNKVVNPLLKNIVDTNEELFSEKIAQITYEEYSVYKDLFEDELQARSDDEEEFDYDDTDL